MMTKEEILNAAKKWEDFCIALCCFANKLRKFFKQSAKKKRRLKGF